jgi:asparaginyl-tRNA synthetase
MVIRISQLEKKHIGQEVTIRGWVRSVRDQKKFAFIVVNDGSNVNGLQVVYEAVDLGYEETIKEVTNGCSIIVVGKLVQSPGKGQDFELKADTVNVVGLCDAETYPLQKKQHTFEFLRTIAHLRARTNTIGAVARVRNALSFATHKFFQEKGFLYIHTPIISTSDCEGAGEMFTVSKLSHDKPPRKPDGTVDYEQDYFARQAFLTVSGQLELETYACALSNVYTFGPTFRAENSNTARHLSEFWMVEPEIAYAELKDVMTCAESYLKYCLKYLLETCHKDMEFFDAHVKPGVLEKLEHVANSPFEQLTYTEAIKILEKCGKKFDYPVQWGIDLQTEHERYLAEEHCKKPVILTNYPKGIKAFYMKVDPDGKTVAAMDILVPSVGEIIGGSQREERYDVLEKRIIEMGLKPEDYWWYLELRKYGTVPHGGFGLGLERLILFSTGMENIRDVIPFPRYPQHAEF